MRVTNHINKSKMKVKEVIEALSYYDGDDDITFYFLKNDTLTNCQVEDISFYSDTCLLYTSPSPRDGIGSRMPSSA